MTCELDMAELSFEEIFQGAIGHVENQAISACKKSYRNISRSLSMPLQRRKDHTGCCDKAIRALVRQYDRLVKDDDLSRLVEIHREKRLPSDPEYALLPYHLIVLEYQNEERWADLHPAVRMTRKFRDVWANEKRKKTKK
jgi:hypothetical protein